MFHIVVCGGIVPDPLQTLEPVKGPAGWGLKNELMLPSILDPWASHALYEAAHLAKSAAGSKVWLVSLGPKAKLQQVMVAQIDKMYGQTISFLDWMKVGVPLATVFLIITWLLLTKVLFRVKGDILQGRGDALIQSELDKLGPMALACLSRSL